MLETGQDGSIVYAVFEAYGFVGAERLICHEPGAGVHDQDIEITDREFLHAVRRDLAGTAHAFPDRSAGGGGWLSSMRGQRIPWLDVDLVRPSHAGIVAKPFDGQAADDVRGEDVVQIGLPHAGIPDVLGVDDNHRAMPALREASRLVDADVAPAGLLGAGAEDLHVSFDVPLRRASLSTRADEDVTIVLAHRRSFQLNLS